MRKTGRKSMIGGIAALSLILAGTGYAYWTDTLNVTTKATTGDLDVTFVDLGLYAQYGNEQVGNGWSIVDGIKRDSKNGFIPDDYFMRGTDNYNIIAKPGTVDKYVKSAEGINNVTFDASYGDDAGSISKQIGPYTTATIGSDNIKLEVNNMYPGYAQAFRTDIINLGTLAARLSNMEFEVKGVDDKPFDSDMLGLAVLVQKEQSADDGNAFKLSAKLGSGDNYFTIGGVDFIRLSALTGEDGKMIQKVLQNNEILASPSANRLDLFLAVGMDPDAEGYYTTGSTHVTPKNEKAEDADSQNNAASISINMLWDQFNEGVDAGTSNILREQNVGAKEAE